MRCDEIIHRGYRTIEEASHDFLNASILTLSDRLGFDNEPYLKSFKSLVRTKDYTYMVTNDDKVS